MLIRMYYYLKGSLMKISTVVLVVVITMCVVMNSGCQATLGFARDVKGAASWTENALTPLADQAMTRDVEREEKRLARYHAEKAGFYSKFDNSENK